MLLASLLLLAVGCAPEKASVMKISGATMGTLFHLTIVDAPTELCREQLAVSINEILQQVDAARSTYRSDSELNRFNRSATW
ncbi:MAG: FAD:protein FMN transferase [Planctomycetes bacterium]|nr:FAD:protein FMN transferase [Planctomycetota bacterium]